MRRTARGFPFVSLVVATAALVACGGGPAEPAPAPTPAPMVEAAPEPPPGQTMDVQPGSISVGGNALSGTMATDNLLPPSLFGAISGLSFKTTTVNAPITAVTFTQANDSAKTLTISVDASGNVTWSNDLGAITAYDPGTPADCGRMSANLAPYFASGNSISYTSDGRSVAASLTAGIQITATITPSSNACGG